MNPTPAAGTAWTARPLVTAALCGTALVGFAANSLLCRDALGAGAIDAGSFTAIRLASGALVLVGLARSRVRGAGSWPSAAALFAYAAAFSFAYLRLTAATGALILFAMVQATMIGTGIARGERPRRIEWIGIALAAGGLIALTLPGLTAPDPVGAALMALAGISWGVYSLRGRGAHDPLAVTADNFLRTLLFVAVLGIAIAIDGHATTRGIVLAIISGAITSGIGYSFWYAALRHITATRAAIVQLSVPVLTTVAAVAILGETVTPRLAGGTIAIVGGIALALTVKRPAGERSRTPRSD